MVNAGKYVFIAFLAILVSVYTTITIISTQQTTQQSNIANVAHGTMLDVKTISLHNNQGDCWTIIDNKVYDISNYITAHPGGPIITQACGTDATEMFATKGGNGNNHSDYAHQLLASFLLGNLNSIVNSNNTNSSTLNSKNVPADLQEKLNSFQNLIWHDYTIIVESNGKYYTITSRNGILTVQEGIFNEKVSAPISEETQVPLTESGIILDENEIAKHNKQSDCWIIIDGNVYNVTSYISIHPGGVAMITNNCGTEATSAFATKGGTGGTHSSFAMNLLKSFLLGPVAKTPTSPPVVTIIEPTYGQQFDAATTSITLSITTDKDATCKFSKTDQDYSIMTSTFATTGKKSHVATISSLSDGVSYKRYIRCADTTGNIMQNSAVASFSIATPLATAGNYTMADVSQHSTQSDCWIVIDGNVYDVTSYIAIHPGGVTMITNNCGTDASSAFATKGGTGGTHSTFAKNLLASFLLGPLSTIQTSAPTATITAPTLGALLASGTTSTTLRVTTNIAATCKFSTTNQAYSSMPNTFSTTGGTTHTTTLSSLSDGQSYTRYVRCSDANGNSMQSSVSTTFSVDVAPTQTPQTGTVTYTLADVAQHSTQNDCWLAINAKVYAVTSYIPIHPGGITRITNVCGTDASTAFNTKGGQGSHSTSAKNMLATLYIGELGTTSSGTTTGTNGTTTGGGTTTTTIPTIQEVIQAAYPGATIKEINTGDNGTSEVQIKYNGQDKTIRLDANHNII